MRIFFKKIKMSSYCPVTTHTSAEIKLIPSLGPTQPGEGLLVPPRVRSGSLFKGARTAGAELPNPRHFRTLAAGRPEEQPPPMHPGESWVPAGSVQHPANSGGNIGSRAVHRGRICMQLPRALSTGTGSRAKSESPPNEPGKTVPVPPQSKLIADSTSSSRGGESMPKIKGRCQHNEKRYR